MAHSLLCSVSELRSVCSSSWLKQTENFPSVFQVLTRRTAPTNLNVDSSRSDRLTDWEHWEPLTRCPEPNVFSTPPVLMEAGSRPDPYLMLEMSCCCSAVVRTSGSAEASHSTFFSAAYCFSTENSFSFTSGASPSSCSTCRAEGAELHVRAGLETLKEELKKLQKGGVASDVEGN